MKLFGVLVAGFGLEGARFGGVAARYDGIGVLIFDVPARFGKIGARVAVVLLDLLAFLPDSNMDRVDRGTRPPGPQKISAVFRQRFSHFYRLQ